MEKGALHDDDDNDDKDDNIDKHLWDKSRRKGPQIAKMNSMLPRPTLKTVLAIGCVKSLYKSTSHYITSLSNIRMGNKGEKSNFLYLTTYHVGNKDSKDTCDSHHHVEHLSLFQLWKWLS